MEQQKPPKVRLPPPLTDYQPRSSVPGKKVHTCETKTCHTTKKRRATYSAAVNEVGLESTTSDGWRDGAAKHRLIDSRTVRSRVLFLLHARCFVTHVGTN